jgi:chromosome segregation ATPase
MSSKSSDAKSIKNLSPFGQYALTLDSDFIELERLSGQIERLDIESDAGMDRAKQLLAKFGETGQRIADGVQGLAKTLEETRGRAEKAAEFVASRAAKVQERQQENNRMMERFQALGERVRGVSASIAELKKPAGETMTDEGKAEVRMKLTDFESELGKLIDESQQLKQDAQAASMKTLERNADSLNQTLQSARRKLTSLH